MSFASSLVWVPDCKAAAGEVAFFAGYMDMFGDECRRTQDSTAILTYEALLTFTQAARNARRLMQKLSLKKYRPIAARNEDEKVCSGLR